MASRYHLSVQNDAIATAAAWTALTADFVGGTANRNVPPGVSKISQIIVCAAQDGAAGADTSVGLRISGTGVGNGVHTFAPVAGANAGTVAGDGRMDQAIIIPNLAIPVTPNGNVDVEAAMTTDIGSIAVGVTLCFE